MQTNLIKFNTYKLERGGLLVDMYDQFNARVGDQGTPLVIQWTQGTTDTPVDLQKNKLHFYAAGQVGKYLEKLDDDTGYKMSADASGVEYDDKDSAGTQANGLTVAKLPKQFFPQEGIFYGYFGLKDDQGNTYTSVNVWFRVLGGVPIMGAAIPYFSTRFDELMEKCQGRIEDALAQLRAEYQAEVQKNEDMSAETRAQLDELATEVGTIYAHIKAGDVVTLKEYLDNKETTDAAVEANTKELQSHDAQLKQLTASPASDGTTEITNARIGTAEQSARTYTTLGEAIRDQAGQATRALKNSFEERYTFPYKKEDNTAYNKDSKTSTTSGSIYYFNITGVPLIRIKTKVEPYVNFFTFLDINNQVLNYQRNDDKTATVDFVVTPPTGAITLVLGAEPGTTNSKDSVTIFDKGYKVGKFYQGSINDDMHYIEHGPNRASLVIDSDNYENLITASDDYQIRDDHLQSWVSQVLIPQGSEINSVLVRKSDDSAILSTEMYSHFNCQQIPKSKLHLKSYRNGLTDISDIFDLSYNNVFADEKDSHYYPYSKDIPTGSRIASQFVTVNHNTSWLIDLDDGYEVNFAAGLRDSAGQNIKHNFYNSINVLKTTSNWVGGHVYENLYTQGAYAVIFRKNDGSLANINTIWDHVRIYEVDNTVHFPDYYRSHMQDRVATINGELTSPDNFGFGFITDVHAEYNTKHFPALIDEVRTKTPVNEFLGGGDWATAWFDAANDADQKPELFTFFEDLRRLFKDVPLLKTVGNHEWAYGANNAYNITSQEMYAYYLRDEDKMFSSIQWGPDHTYYYWDDQQAKCRYISLNVMDYPDTVKPTGNADNKEWYFKVSDTQINWLKTTLNSVPDGYVVAIESHLVPLNADQFASFPAAKIGTTITNGEDLQAIASAYAAKTGDFAGAKGDLLGWFGGHYHADDITVRNGVAYITTLADCMSVSDIKGGPQKTAGTVSEQAFDVATVDRASRRVSLTRIGAGSDRSFTY